MIFLSHWFLSLSWCPCLEILVKKIFPRSHKSNFHIRNSYVACSKLNPNPMYLNTYRIMPSSSERSLEASRLLSPSLSMHLCHVDMNSSPLPEPVLQHRLAPLIIANCTPLPLMNIVTLYRLSRLKSHFMRPLYALGDLYHSVSVLKPSHSLPVAASIILLLQ